MADLTEPDFDDEQPEIQPETLDVEGSELQLSITSELSEKSEEEAESTVSQESMDDEDSDIQIASESEQEEPK